MELIIPGLFELASNMEGDLLMLCLDSLRVCVSVRPDIVALEADKVNKFLVELFVKHASDTFIVSQVSNIINYTLYYIYAVVQVLVVYILTLQGHLGSKK